MTLNWMFLDKLRATIAGNAVMAKITGKMSRDKK